MAKREPRPVLRAGESFVSKQAVEGRDGAVEGASDDARAGEAAPAHSQPNPDSLFQSR